MPKRKIDELYEVLTVGLHAIHYLAMKVHSVGRTFEFIATADGEPTCVGLAEKHRAALTEAIKQADALLQFLGEFENETDGVNEDDENATAHAFAAMRRMKEEPRGPQE